MASKFLHIRTPATSANMGSGFDCLGIALNLYNELSVTPSESNKIRIQGEGSAELSTDDENLIFQSAKRFFETIGRPVQKMNIDCINRIPLARGLGSSGAATLGGLIAANVMEGNPLANQELLQLAVQIEGYPDNVTAGLLGGCQIAIQSGQGPEVITSEVLIEGNPSVVIFVPESQMPTEHARAILPREVDREDAIFNLGRVALLINSLRTGKWQDLKTAMEDRLHQPYRTQLLPGLNSLIASSTDAGAVGAFLSGAGSTVTAIAIDNERQIAQNMQRSAKEEGLVGTTQILAIDKIGTQVTER
ncbi:MAG: homoserine kinase [SAR202 cluster bacterium]|nr:homoserine kinase [SAR202 cluster bacterium]|tara:strand:+ start:1726 stop:2640 length:915 start_codon:yes stop_codon:yes gene_type:complete